LRMQTAEFDQENWSDVHIWKGNEHADNNCIEDIDMFLIDELMASGPNLVSNAENVPSTSEIDKAPCHEQWKPPFKRQLSDQKLEERREKKRRSAKESRER
ncbi:unnamed protein product, partial [Candidula unifasciata]